MLETVQRYRALARESQRIFWRAVILLPMVRASLRLRGYNQTFATLQKRLTSTAAQQSESREVVQKTSRMVRAALRHSLIKYTCLEESLTLWYLLQKQGVSTQLRIGVRKTGGKFEAHAWVEYESVALNQPDEIHKHYAAFDKEFSGPRAEQP